MSLLKIDIAHVPQWIVTTTKSFIFFLGGRETIKRKAPRLNGDTARDGSESAAQRCCYE
jgi:hypothetical protein